jgi:hypothetical protein
MNLRRWLRDHSLKLLAIRDTPDAIARGVAIGIFFGFVPVFGIKNLSAIVLAWLTRSNILAAVIAGAMHDAIFPLMPAIYWWQYRIGFWLLSSPHRWPQGLIELSWKDQSWRDWHTFLSVGGPWLLGSILFSTPWAMAAHFITRRIVIRHHAKRAAAQAVEERPPQDPP